MPAGEILADALDKWGLTAELREHRIVTAWVDLVGEKIASRARPSGLKKGVLVVDVASSTWLHQLSFLKDDLRSKINARLGGPPAVKELRLQMAGARSSRTAGDAADVAAAPARRRAPAATVRPPARVTPADTRRIEAETARVSDPELRDLIHDLRVRLGL